MSAPPVAQGDARETALDVYAVIHDLAKFERDEEIGPHLKGRLAAAMKMLERYRAALSQVEPALPVAQDGDIDREAHAWTTKRCAEPHQMPYWSDVSAAFAAGARWIAAHPPVRVGEE